MNWKVWLRGLGSVVIGGAAGAVADSAATVFKGGSVDTGHLGGAALTGAILMTVGYLKQSPLPKFGKAEDFGVTKDKE
jgi:hypothetical protein